ncbi:hypothetical protein [Halorubrum sp. CSM-61]|uniref:hypothetical protein n=1 Tax=Halorubrum sp. CSM-61 TaxID=2485838 RepID=UPI000F4C07FD|nr:hypothetical protein [Halorubrum sp. CSM-61]
MPRPSAGTLLAGFGGGAVHLAVVELLFRALNHAPPERWPSADLGRATGLFAAGFLVALVVAHTRLLSPAGGLGLALAWATLRDALPPPPEWSEVGGFLVVDRTVFLSAYAGGWTVVVGLLAVAAGVEFGLRRRHGIGGDRLRNLPPAPSRVRDVALVGVALGGVFGVAATARIAAFGVSPETAVPVMAATTTVAAAVPVAAAALGLVSPAVCFALLVPPLARGVLTGGEGGPVLLLFLGPAALALAAVGLVERWLRRRLDRAPAESVG